MTVRKETKDQNKMKFLKKMEVLEEMKVQQETEVLKELSHAQKARVEGYILDTRVQPEYSFSADKLMGEPTEFKAPQRSPHPLGIAIPLSSSQEPNGTSVKPVSDQGTLLSLSSSTAYTAQDKHALMSYSSATKFASASHNNDCNVTPVISSLPDASSSCDIILTDQIREVVYKITLAQRKAKEEERQKLDNCSIRVIENGLSAQAQAYDQLGYHVKYFFRKLQPIPCTLLCKKMCEFMVTHKKRMQMFQAYWSIPKDADRRKWISQRMAMNSNRNSFKYYYARNSDKVRVQVCKNFFLATIDENLSYVDEIEQSLRKSLAVQELNDKITTMLLQMNVV